VEIAVFHGGGPEKGLAGAVLSLGRCHVDDLLVRLGLTCAPIAFTVNRLSHVTAAPAACGWIHPSMAA